MRFDDAAALQVIDYALLFDYYTVNAGFATALAAGRVVCNVVGITSDVTIVFRAGFENQVGIVVDCFQVVTSAECHFANGCQALGDSYACEAFTLIESCIADCCYTIANCQACNSCTTCESVPSNGFYATGDGYTCKAFIPIECIVSNMSYTLGDNKVCNLLSVEL